MSKFGFSGEAFAEERLPPEKNGRWVRFYLSDKLTYVNICLVDYPRVQPQSRWSSEEVQFERLIHLSLIHI